MALGRPSPQSPQLQAQGDARLGWFLAGIFVLLGIAEHAFFASSNGEVIRDHGLVDSDSYMRVMRILDLYHGAGWYDTMTMRVGAPEGLSLHWTRPVDILILLPALAAHLFGVDVGRAVYWIGAAFSPICHILACLATAWAARPLWSTAETRGGHRFAALILLTNAAAFGYGAFGRADHHTLLLLLTALMLGAALRAAIAWQPVAGERRWAALAGIYAGLGIWVSPELMVPITPIISAIGLFWLDAPLDQQKNGGSIRDWAGIGVAFSLAMAAVILIAIPVEQPPAHWLMAEYDKVSLPYLVVPLIWAAIFFIARRVQGGFLTRLIAGLLLGAAGAAVLLGLFPDLLFGPLGVNQRLKTDFLDTIREMQPLWPTSFGRLLSFLPMLGQSVTALILLPFALRRWRNERRWAGQMLMLAFGFLLIAGMMHARLGVEFAPTPAIICAGFFALLDGKLKGRSPLLRTPALVATAVLLTCGPLLVGSAINGITWGNTGKGDAGTCKLRELTDWLNANHPGKGTADGGAPIIMADDYSYGPELAFRTNYRVVAGPYHRNPQAIFDSIDTMIDYTGTKARAILDRRQVSLITRCTAVIVPHYYDALHLTLYDRLGGTGSLPAWLTKLDLPPDLAKRFRVYEVQGR
jgi:hypothetical protein